MFSDWIRSLGVGTTAYLLQLPDLPSDPNTPDISLYLSLLEYLERKLLEAKESDADLYHNIPPVTLEQLARLDPADFLGSPLEHEAKGWAKAAEELRPRLRTVRALAHHVRFGPQDPAVSTAFADALDIKSVNLVRVRYDKHAGPAETKFLDYQNDLQTIRSGWTTTDEKLVAIQRIAPIFQPSRDWPQLENALYHQVFAWPLLVSSDEWPALSLPVAIDLRFDPVQRTRRYEDEEAEGTLEVLSTGVIDAGQWHEPLVKAAHAARVLWRGKHGNNGPFRRKIWQATVVIDLRFAEQVIAEIPGVRESGFRVREGSHEAYFATAVLARFVGSCLGSSSVVTGVIGPQRSDNYGDLPDFELKWPAGVGSKIRYVFSAALFERVVLPNPSEEKVRTELATDLLDIPKIKHVDKNFCNNLQTVADVLLGSEWRQHWFIRCPDVAAADSYAESALQQWPALRDRVISCQGALSENQERTVLQLDGFTPNEVARTLWYISKELRHRLPGKTPPAPSVAFIRAMDYEQDSRFWEMVWRVCGAPWSEFDRFDAAPSDTEAARILASVLNTFEPTEAFPRFRAPDVLVIIGTDRFAKSLSRTFNPKSRRRGFQSIVSALEKGNLLRHNLSQHMIDLAGTGRLILISEDVYDPERPRALLDAGLTTDQRTLLRRLATFRFDFTQQMAGMVLAAAANQDKELERDPEAYLGAVRATLDDLTRRGALGRVHGKWYVKTGKQFLDQAPGNPREMYVAHATAMQAMCPYLWPWSPIGLALDRALDPQVVREAKWHYSQFTDACAAIGLTDEEEKFKARIRQNHIYLQLYSDYRSMSSLFALKRGTRGEEGVRDLVAECLARAEAVSVGGLAHPIDYNLVGDVLRNFLEWLELRRHRDTRFGDRVYLEALKQEIVDAYDRGADACARPDIVASEEASYDLLTNRARRAVFLAKHPRSASDKAAVATLIKECLDIRNRHPGMDHSAAPGEFYELVGDREKYHEPAARYYSLGVSTSTEYAQLLIKYVGALRLAKRLTRTHPVFDLLAKISLSPEEILLRARTTFIHETGDRSTRDWVVERWNAGLEAWFLKWGSQRAVMSALRSYDRAPVRSGKGTTSVR